MQKKPIIFIFVLIMVLPFFWSCNSISGNDQNSQEMDITQTTITKEDNSMNHASSKKNANVPICGGTLTEEDVRKMLSAQQYHVVRENGTEPSYNNEYWDNKKEGIYVDIVCGKPLFSSIDKFDSGTGWPSFTAPIDPDAMGYFKDASFGTVRVELRSTYADSHLGHIFDDGPNPRRLRYCINSASLRFIPLESLEKEGYGAYIPMFQQKEALLKVNAEKALLGGGCFWGLEAFFKRTIGILDTAVGYAGGTKDNPTYKEVCSSTTNHAEVVLISFDPRVISYRRLLHVFFSIHDPTQVNQQGHDVGTQYRTVIFFYTDDQKKVAEEVKLELNQSSRYSKPVATEIITAPTFYDAEEYHQDYLDKNPGGYCHVDLSKTDT